jgi:hypothetical protein
MPTYQDASNTFLDYQAIASSFDDNSGKEYAKITHEYKI